jgi:hypothetical protein
MAVFERNNVNLKTLLECMWASFNFKTLSIEHLQILTIERQHIWVKHFIVDWCEDVVDWCEDFIEW